MKEWMERALVGLANRRKRRPTDGTSSKSGLGHEIGSGGDRRGFELDPADRLRHLYVLGATGCGKTNLLRQLIKQDVDRGTTCVVMDMRGDLVDSLGGTVGSVACPELVYAIDLRQPGSSYGVNPFLGGDDPYGAALMVHSVLRESAESWGVQLDETLRYALIVLSYNQMSLADLPRLLYERALRREVVHGVPDDEVSAFFERFDQLSADRQSAWIQPVLNKVSPFLAHPSVRSLLSAGPALDFKSVLEMPGALVLVSLAADRMHGLASTFGCLVVSAIQNAAMARADVPERCRNPVHLYLDEFENFQSPAFESIIAEGRRFRLGLTLSHQNLGQLDRQLRQVVTNNAGTRVYFRTGHTDAKELAGELSAYGVDGAANRLVHLPVGRAFVVGVSKRAKLVQFNEADRSEPARIQMPPSATGRPQAVPVETKTVRHVRKPRAAMREGAADAT